MRRLTRHVSLFTLLLLALSGCGTSHPPPPTSRYPVTEMLDPVTETTPNVILPR